MIRRIVCVLLACLFLVLPLYGCGGERDEARVRIVCTVFPFYDWVRNIVGDVEGVEVLWLADNGSDLHSYQPSAADLIALGDADLVVYVGGTSDGWVTDAIKQGGKKNGMPLVKEEGVTLRPVSAESGHSHEDGHQHEEDEHLWLSLRNAAVCVERICERLCALDAEYAEQYRSNATSYKEALLTLDASFAESVAKAEKPRLLFADRFPFVYLLEDYGIEYRAAFSGCTTDVDADFSTVIKLAQTADAWNLSYIMVTESSDGSLAESVNRASQQKNRTVLRLESMQAIRKEQAQKGMTYRSVMEENFSAVRTALGLNLDQ